MREPGWIAQVRTLDAGATRGLDTDTPMALAARLTEQLHRQPDLLPRGCRVLVALSGGPDSTALVHLLDRLASVFNWDVQAAHFDHGVRRDSSREANHLVHRMQMAGIHLHVGRPDHSLQPAHDVLRAARYRWLETVADRSGADRIATGHHQDDQAETVLFRILRGTGNRGLTGIPVRRGRIVRPLLGFSAEEIRDWVTDEGLPATDDASNRDARWARNRIRHHLLPALGSGAQVEGSKSLLAIQEAAESVDRAMDRLATAALAGVRRGPGLLDRAALLSWPDELRTEILRQLARARGVRLTRGSATSAARDLARLRSGHRIDLGGGLSLERSFDNLVLSLGRQPLASATELSISGVRDGESSLSLGSHDYAVRWGSEVGPTRGAVRVALSLQRDHYPLKVRSWKAGDRIRLPGGSRKLKRVFGDARVPVNRRHSIPIVADSGGRVLWVAGVARCSEPTMATDKELVIEIEDA